MQKAFNAGLVGAVDDPTNAMRRNVTGSVGTFLDIQASRFAGIWLSRCGWAESAFGAKKVPHGLLLALSLRSSGDAQLVQVHPPSPPLRQTPNRRGLDVLVYFCGASARRRRRHRYVGERRRTDDGCGVRRHFLRSVRFALYFVFCIGCGLALTTFPVLPVAPRVIRNHHAALVASIVLHLVTPQRELARWIEDVSSSWGFTAVVSHTVDIACQRMANANSTCCQDWRGKRGDGGGWVDV